MLQGTSRSGIWNVGIENGFGKLSKAVNSTKEK
jgi:hypothetical protein